MAGDRGHGRGREDDELASEDHDVADLWPGKRTRTEARRTSGPVDPGKRSSAHAIAYRPATQFDARAGEAETAIGRLQQAIEARDFSAALGSASGLRRCLSSLQDAVTGSTGDERPARKKAFVALTARATPILGRAPSVSDQAWKEFLARTEGPAWKADAQAWYASLGGAPTTRLAAGTGRVPIVVVDALESEQGSSLPDADTWSRRVGGDVQAARLVTGPKAAAAADAVGARAFTVGHRVFFSAGADPATDHALVAHELAHVVQQKGASTPASWHDLEILEASHPHEHEARGGRGSSSTSAMAIARDQKVTAEDYANDTYVVKDIAHQMDYLPFVAAYSYGDLLEPTDFRRELVDLLGGYMKLMTFKGLGEAKGTVTALGDVDHKLAELVAPDNVATLIDRARGMDWTTDKDDKPIQLKTGANKASYATAVAVELANAIVRRYKDSIARAFPRFIAAWVTNRPRVVILDGDGVEQYLVQPRQVLASHPLDLYVIQALCKVQRSIDFKKLREVPELANAGIISTRPINLELSPFIKDQNLWHWVRAEPADATPEEVAGELFGRPELAHLLVVEKPLFGFWASAVASFTMAKRTALMAKANGVSGVSPDIQYQIAPAMTRSIRAEPEQLDPLEELASHGRESDARRLGVAEATSETLGAQVEVDVGAVVDVANDNLRVLTAIRGMFEQLKVPVHSVEMATSFQYLKRNVAIENGLDSVPGTYFLLAEQASQLTRISLGIATAMQEMTPEKHGALAYPPVLEVCEVMSSAVMGLAFPRPNEARIVRGEELVRNIAISVLESEVHDALPRTEHDIDAGKDATYDAVYANQHLQSHAGALSELRVQSDMNPAKAQQDIAAETKKVDDLTFDVSLHDKLTQLNELWSAIDSTDDSFWVPLGDKVDGAKLKQTNRGYYYRFLIEVFSPYTIGRGTKNKVLLGQARDNFKALVNDAGFIAHAKEVVEHLETSNKHKRWTKIIVAIAITVVAFAIGQWQFGLLLQAGLMPMDAAIAAGVTTTVASMAMNKLILNQGPGSFGEVLTSFIGNIATFYVIGRMAMAARAAALEGEIASSTATAAKIVGADVAKTAVATGEKVSFSVKAAKYAVGLGKEAILAEVIGYTQLAIANKIDGKKAIPDGEFWDIALQQLVGVIGMRIGNHMLEGGFEAYKAFSERDRVDVSWLTKERGELITLANTVAKAHNEPYAKPDRAAALELLQRHKAYLERLREARQKILDDAAKYPSRYNRDAVNKLKTTAVDNEFQQHMDQVTALLGVEQYGPNLYRCEPSALDALVEQQKSSGGKIMAVDTDPLTGVRTLTIKSKDGPPLVVTEKLPQVGKRTAPPVAIPEARSFEHWLEHDAPKQLKPEELQKLRDRYVQDPKDAVASAAREHGYKPTVVTDPKPVVHVDEVPLKTKGSTTGPKGTDTARPMAEPSFKAAGKGRMQSEHPNQLRALRDGIAKTTNERPEIHYDPDTNTAYFETKTPTPSGEVTTRYQVPLGKRVSSMSGLTSAKNQVLGKPIKTARAFEILERLNMGDPSMLAEAGVKGVTATSKIPPGTEFGLARTSSGESILIIGDGMEVDWTHIPLDPLGHTHADVADNNLHGVDSVPLDTMLTDKLGDAARNINRELVLPSAADFITMAVLGISDHMVLTPFVVVDGVVMKPKAGDMSPRLRFKIKASAEVGTSKGKRVYRATIEGSGNGVEVTKEVWIVQEGKSLDGGVFMREPPDFLATMEPGPTPGDLKTSASTRPKPATSTTATVRPPSAADIKAKQAELQTAATGALKGVAKVPPYSVKVLPTAELIKRFGDVNAVVTVEGKQNVIYARPEATPRDLISETYKLRGLSDPKRAAEHRTQWDANQPAWSKRSFADRVVAFRRRLDGELAAYRKMVADNVPNAQKVLERLRHYEHEIALLDDRIGEISAGMAAEPEYIRDPLYPITGSDLPVTREDRHGAFAKNDRLKVPDSSASSTTTTVYQLGQPWVEVDLVVSRHSGPVHEISDGGRRYLVVTEGGIDYRYPLEPKAHLAGKNKVVAGEVMADQTRNYRLVDVVDGKTSSRREEIQMSDDSWIKRGSDSTRAGTVMENAARAQADADIAARQATQAKQGGKPFTAHHLPGNRGGGGFDDVIAEVTRGKTTKARVRVREVKDYPERYVRSADFSAITGADLKGNMDRLGKRVEAAIAAKKANPKAQVEGFDSLTVEDLRAVQDAINDGEVEFEIVLSESTLLGEEGEAGKSVIEKLRNDTKKYGKLLVPSDLQAGGNPERVGATYAKDAEAAKTAAEKAQKKAGPK